jgi:hypothetical protein
MVIKTASVTYDVWIRVARFPLLQHTKNGKTIPNDQKIYENAITYTKRIFQMDLKYTNIVFSKASKIYPNWDFWYVNWCTIWQPCSELYPSGKSDRRIVCVFENNKDKSHFRIKKHLKNFPNPHYEKLLRVHWKKSFLTNFSFPLSTFHKHFGQKCFFFLSCRWVPC